ncbi:hypothetical protein ACFLU4_02125 [Chloroflexota bacterium]
MAKGTVIKGGKVEALIADVHYQHPHDGATKMQREVIKRLHDPKDPFYSPYDEPNWPGVSAVGKILREIKGKEGQKPPEPKQLDQPFTLGALAQYPILPEALPVVLRVYVNRSYTGENETVIVESFTIRDALWVARFSHIPLDPEEIWGFASWYSVRERAYEAMGKLDAIDTTDLDEALIEAIIPTTMEDNREEKEAHDER